MSPFPILNTTPHTTTHPALHNAYIDAKAHFGAAGDGSTNDATAIQNAIDAAVSAGGGEVFFPEGTYICNSTLTINSDSVSLVGANKVGSKIQFGNAVNPGLDLGDNVTQRHYITLTGLTLTRATAGGGPTVRGRKVDQIAFINCHVGYGTRSFEFEQLISSTIAFCGISNNTLEGLQIQNSDQVQVIGNYFEDQDNTVNPHLDLISGNKNISVIGNNFSTALKALEIGVGPNTEIAIVGNTVENCLVGFDLDNGGVGLTRSTVVGNSLRGTAAVGGIGLIVSSANTDVAIVGNVITNYETIFTGTPGAGVEIIANPGIADLRQRADIIATASLPAAAAAENGRIVIEDAGAGDRNLIIYAGGQRFRIDGGANV